MNLSSTIRNTTFLAVLTVIGVGAIVATAMMQYHAIIDYRMLGEAKVLVSDIQADILTLRRNEKDFLTQKDTVYRQRFEQNHELTLANVSELRATLRHHGADEQKIEELTQVLTDYRERFFAIVALQEQIGLHHEDGLYGTFREAIHEVEEILGALRQYQLMKDMLMLRRQEKDFMLRKDVKYLDKFSQDLKLMRADLSRAYLGHRARRVIASALTTYERDFKALAAASEQIGFNSHEGLHGQMRHRIQQGEDILGELRQEVLSLENKAGSHMINQLIISAVVLTIMVGTLIRL